MFSLALKIKTKLNIPQRPTGSVPPALPPPAFLSPRRLHNGGLSPPGILPPPSLFTRSNLILLPDLPSMVTDCHQASLCLLILLSHPCPSLSHSLMVQALVLMLTPLEYKLPLCFTYHIVHSFWHITGAQQICLEWLIKCLILTTKL